MSRITIAEQSALSPIASRGPDMLSNVERWCALNTGSRNLVGLAEMADILVEAFAPLGGETEIRDPEPAETLDETGARIPLAHGRNVHIVRPGRGNRRILLTGHMDTVFPKDHHFQELKWLEDGVLNGPGVADMKGGIAVMLEALTALEASPLAGQIGWEVILNADEEVSSLGSAPLLADAASRCQIGLTFEPAAEPDGTLAGGRKGSGNFAAAITGRAAHAGRNPEDGRNALVAAADLAVRLDTMKHERPTLSVNPAKLDGGGPNNVVPERAVLRWNVRPLTPEDQAWAEARQAELFADIKQRHDVGIDITGSFARPPKPLDDKQLGLFTLVKECGAALGHDIRWKHTGGVCDGNNLAAAGLAVVDTMGVRGGAIHSDREFLIVDSLTERAELAALTLMRLAEGRLDI
ncbi:hydrolase [Pacificimonas sp. WHA3]|uniref:Hydrolase n=1 Tax=Pacificimonas pallii TaxID=2827236 RepID=A0ABS6SC16_9SPHN|nr:hydrolase [Pacificimonas pallii]MBV7255633.1 hydrolase [Pacificimonas pallii]